MFGVLTNCQIISTPRVFAMQLVTALHITAFPRQRGLWPPSLCVSTAVPLILKKKMSYLWDLTALPIRAILRRRNWQWCGSCSRMAFLSARDSQCKLPVAN